MKSSVTEITINHLTCLPVSDFLGYPVGIGIFNRTIS
jgi:hypothetical protein